jgi:hypothetical protein
LASPACKKKFWAGATPNPITWKLFEEVIVKINRIFLKRVGVLQEIDTVLHSYKQEVVFFGGKYYGKIVQRIAPLNFLNVFL